MDSTTLTDKDSNNILVPSRKTRTTRKQASISLLILAPAVTTELEALVLFIYFFLAHLEEGKYIKLFLNKIIKFLQN